MFTNWSTLGQSYKSWATFQWQPGDPHDPNPPMTVESASAPPDAPVLLSRSAMIASIAATWSVVTVTPLFASVLLAHTSEPPVAHASRQLEPASVIRALHPEPSWESQTRRKLVQPFVAPAADDPPFSTRHNYAGEWPVLAWDTQHRAPLVPGSEINSPPFSTRHNYAGEWPTLSWGTQHRAPLVPGSEINDPLPLSHRYTGEWPGLTWESQTRLKLVPIVEAPVVNDPPPLSHRYAGEWPVAVWDTQHRAPLVPGSEINDPPPLSHRYTGEWSPLTWDTQTRIKLVPIAEEAVVNDPPPHQIVSVYGPLAAHYAPPIVTPLWGSVLTNEGPPPVNDPPFAMRGRQAQPIGLQWAPRQLTPIGIARLAQSVDNPPVKNASYRGEWPALTWETQKRTYLVQGGTPPVVDNPPVKNASYRGEWPALTWETQTRPHVVQAQVVQVDNPPFRAKRFTGVFDVPIWTHQSRDAVAQLVASSPVILNRSLFTQTFGRVFGRVN